MTTIFDDPNAKFILPNDSLQFKLFYMVLWKQLHQCQPWCIQKGWNGNCKFEFPFYHILNKIKFLIK